MSEVLVEKVHFMVDFEGMTRHVRDLWAEGSYHLAIDTADALGLSKSEARLVIMGARKMVQDPNGGKGVDGLTVDDDWKPNLNACAYGLYPDPRDMPALERKLYDYKARYLDYATGQARALWEERRNVRFNGARLAEIDRSMASMPDEVLWALGLDRDYLSQQAVEEEMEAEIAERRVQELDAYVKRQLELDKAPKPKPDKKFSHPTGAISPEGKFYTCGWMEHAWLVYEVAGLTIEAARRAGWITIAHPMNQPNHLIITYGDKEPTQRQIDTVADWKRKYTAAEEISTGEGEWDTSFYSED